MSGNQREDYLDCACRGHRICSSIRRTAMVGAAADLDEGCGIGEKDGGGGEADGSIEENEEGDEGRGA